MEFSNITEQEYVTFAKQRKDENFWQSADMAHLRMRNGWNIQYVAVKENGSILAAGMLSYRRICLHMTYVQALRGFYIDYENETVMGYFHRHLIQYLKTLHCMYFQMDPYFPLKERDLHGCLVPNGYDHSDVVTFLKQLGYAYEPSQTIMDTSKEPGWMFVKEIADTTKEELLQDFDHQTRWSIRKSIKTGIQIKEGTFQDIREFKLIMDHTANRRDFQNREMSYYEDLFLTFGKSHHMKVLFAQLDTVKYHQHLLHEIELLQKEYQVVLKNLDNHPGSKKFNKKKKVIEEQMKLLEKQADEGASLMKKGSVITLAPALFIMTGKEIVYLYSGAYKEYLKFHGPYAIQWYMLQYAISHGYETYNFYGISGDFHKQAPDSGIYEFKKGFKGSVVELLGEFTYYVKPKWYLLYNFLRKGKRRIMKR